MDYSQPGSFVHGISQARILEWVAISSSRGFSWSRDWTHISCTAGRLARNIWEIVVHSKLATGKSFTALPGHPLWLVTHFHNGLVVLIFKIKSFMLLFVLLELQIFSSDLLSESTSQAHFYGRVLWAFLLPPLEFSWILNHVQVNNLRLKLSRMLQGFPRDRLSPFPTLSTPDSPPPLICSHPYSPSLVCRKALTSKAIPEFQRAILIREMRNAETKENSQARQNYTRLAIK